jgi:hypothetical protein
MRRGHLRLVHAASDRAAHGREGRRPAPQGLERELAFLHVQEHVFLGDAAARAAANDTAQVDPFFRGQAPGPPGGGGPFGSLGATADGGEVQRVLRGRRDRPEQVGIDLLVRGADDSDGRKNRHLRSGRGEDFQEHAVDRGFHFENGLFGFHLADDLAARDRLAFLFEPADH